MMTLIHSCETWSPDLTEAVQLEQAELNWPRLGAADAELATWARLYGVALLDRAADSLPELDELKEVRDDLQRADSDTARLNAEAEDMAATIKRLRYRENEEYEALATEIKRLRKLVPEHLRVG